ncbi:hypothetical protein VP01_35g11 [Puccinia sorghi]|uniref:tRNA(Phe) (4-demethylwyosine(37)-C(7)) aminocarboxypropyltransferase n=1 Tax=Puccinia sorghi TaxID=27349 RepID=A0A0L6UVY0_9BASI|nr:hypothetical protein VP01_35g11 [Puccinia sorghi]
MNREETHQEQTAEEGERLHAICARQAVYDLKLLLKQHALFDPKRPLITTSDALHPPSPSYHNHQPSVKIPTTLTRLAPSSVSEDHGAILPINHTSFDLPQDLIHPASALVAGFQWIPESHHDTSRKQQSASPLIRAVNAFFDPQTAAGLLSELPKWELYDQFALFQPNAFLSARFSDLLLGPRRREFFATVAAEFRVSHVARKGLIERDDVSRRPRLEPLHGEFGRSEEEFQRAGDRNKFEDVFWTGTGFPTAQGVVRYVWAPSETMYSRGNSPEKRRIAGLSNVAGSVVVDMCCGIGFFVFPYLLAGAAQVIGCEISPWAVEGLRRGAIANGVSYQILEPKAADDLTYIMTPSAARLLIFPGRNELAVPIYRHRATHVNLGLLPSSLEFLPQAVQALRPQGGWLHIHGELAVPGGPSGRLVGAQRWAAKLQQLVLRHRRQSATVVDIHWIKSIGPAKVHLVVELHVGSEQTSQ